MSTCSRSTHSVPSFSYTAGADAKYRSVLGAVVSVLLVGALGCSGDEGGVERDEQLEQSDALTTVEENQAAPVMDADSELPGTGPNLVVTSGWVPNNSNGVGIQGSFFTYGDASGRTLIAEDPTASATGYCVTGESGQVIDADFGGTWGAVAALNLRQAVGVDTAGAYNARSNGVVGFGFDIVGSTGGQLRFVSKQFNVHDGFCEATEIPDCGEGCSVEVMIADMTQNCWDAGGATPLVSELSAIEWQVTTSEAGPTAFSYCIENIHALMGSAAN